MSLGPVTYGFEQKIPMNHPMSAQSHEFSIYIVIVGTVDLLALGWYTDTLMTQSLVTRELFRSCPRIPGDTAVNTSLLDLLNSITSTIPITTLVWNPEKR